MSAVAAADGTTARAAARRVALVTGLVTIGVVVLLAATRGGPAWFVKFGTESTITNYGRSVLGQDVAVPFDEAQDCRMHGMESKLVDGSEPDAKKVKPPRTHWDMLLERRSVDELEEILQERLAELHSRRGA